MRYFHEDGRDCICYLPVLSQTIIQMHDDLYVKFNNVYADSFDFIPHLSLFYSNRNLINKEKNHVQKIYEDVESITFDRLALAAEKKNGAYFLKIQAL